MKENDLHDLICALISCAILTALFLLLTSCVSNPNRPTPKETYPGVVLIKKKF